VGCFATIVWNVSPTAEIHPVKTIGRVTEQFGKSKALVGLRQAANDTIEETSSWSIEARSILDDALKSAGIVTMSEIARQYSAKYKRIVKRGVIRDETEYYLVYAVLIAQGNSVADDERAHLQKLIDAYEAIA
jgi:hypothetical protein